MQKQLIQKVSEAMEANADTIAQQREIIDYQAQTIEELKTSLTVLAETQAQELKSLPTMFEALETSLSKYMNEQKAWRQHRKEYTEGQIVLAEQLVILANTQLQLTKALSEYQSTLILSDDLKIDLTVLETMLVDTMKQLKSSQHEIELSQKKLSSELETVAKLVNK